MPELTKKPAKLPYVLALLLLATLLLLPIKPDIADDSAGLLLLVALFMAIANFIKSPRASAQAWRLLARNEKNLLLAFAAFALFLLPAVYKSQQPAAAWSYWGRYAYLLCLTPVYLIFRQNIKLLSQTLSLGAMLCAVGLLLRCWYYNDFGRQATRYFGELNPITLGDFAALMCIYLCASSYHLKLGRKLLYLLAALAALLAVYYSQSRGAMLTVLLIPVVALLFVRNYKIKSLAVLLLLVLVMAIIVAIQQATWMRGAVAWHNLVAYFTGGNQCTSVGLRLQLWQYGLLAWQQNPIFGVGLADWKTATTTWYYQGNLQKCSNILSYYHAHSIYIHTLATAGLVGFMAMLSVGFTQIIAAIKARCSRAKRSVPLLVILLYASTGMTETWTVKALSLMVLVIFALITTGECYATESS